MGANGEAARVVLVIEDDGIVRESIAEELRCQGWRVLRAANSQEAVSLLSTHEIDVLFTDIDLGDGLNGWDLADAVRAAMPAIPIVYTSGNPSDLKRQLAGSVFIGKPYDPDFIVEACHNLWADRAGGRD